ncbi:hypothetical protein TRVL_07395 [Trypanosoma vivax]|nr:hypothetical protein TRVL_07395 [Trypanosoma vivax]
MSRRGRQAAVCASLCPPVACELRPFRCLCRWRCCCVSLALIWSLCSRSAETWHRGRCVLRFRPSAGMSDPFRCFLVLRRAFLLVFTMFQVVSSFRCHCEKLHCERESLSAVSGKCLGCF